MEQMIASLKNDWQQIAPELPFQFSFLDDNLNVRYQADQQFSRLINFFSLLAIMIAGMGLYGMIAIIASYRIKEIGIRKILGASVMNIYVLLARNFVILVLLANLIAVPIAWWLIQKWLEGFAYHTDIHMYVFLAAIIISIGIALLSLSYQVIKSAMENPINAIRKE
jgi:putative ABC transport system permease protein